ncbi:UDP-N-acetylglucosamine 2-epimerase [Pseudobutyrivibrio sp.]|uniref:UDP-N-acetylglucosamine 2-epimerase n=1 Tax=Pseudobutyrivibrio sp. TaxID=2014367 RepID=UPI00386E3BC3
MRKICVITGTRAEFGLLSGLMRLIQQSEHTTLQVVATNMHLSERYGSTYREIEEAGFAIDYKVPMLDESANDDSTSTLKAMSRALMGFAEAYDALHPELIVVLGDRYEILAAVEAALIKQIPVAHIHGGELTLGAYDDAIRHSITKMSHLHFTSTEEYRKRVIQLGEQPQSVFYVGALGVENIKHVPLMSKEEIEQNLQFEITDRTILVTYHPVTLSDSNPLSDINALFEALDEHSELHVIFTMPNSDTGGQVIAEAIEQYAAQHTNRVRAYKSLGMRRYLSVMKYCVAVIGNSSSGILETPSFHIPTLNIGSRQDGRIAAESVYNCSTNKDSISAGLEYILSLEFHAIAAKSINPYEKDGTAQAIFNVISTYPLDGILQKKFYDL